MLPSTVIGLTYLAIGIFGIFMNALTIALLVSDVRISNPTYYCMCQLCVCDILSLVPFGLYTGLALIDDSLQHVMAYRVFAYSGAIAFYGGSGFTVLMTVSRCVQLIRPHQTKLFFRKQLLNAYTYGMYIGYAVVFSFTFYPNWPLAFSFFPASYTWAYEEDRFARMLASINLGCIFVCLTLIVCFNARSLYWVRTTRRQVRTIVASKNRKRELRLFAQCAVTSLIYAVASALFFTWNFVRRTSRENAMESTATHLFWLIVFTQNPIVYFVINKRLRRRFRAAICCCWGKCVDQKNIHGMTVGVGESDRLCTPYRFGYLRSNENES